MHPRTHEQIQMDLDSQQYLVGQLSTTRESDFVVVYVHGFVGVRYGEKAQAVEAACSRRGWNFATFDFRGHGESSGSIRELRGSQLLEDLDAIYHLLQQRGMQHLCLVGSSMGGWASAWWAMQHPERVVANVLIAPGFHFLTARWERLNEEERLLWQQTGILNIQNDWIDVELGYGLVEEADRYPQERLLQEYQTPTLIFHGWLDDIVDPQRIWHFIEHCRYPHLELRLYKDGDHRLTDRKEYIAEDACQFFQHWLERSSITST